ncbi:MAG: hypothetical protein FWF51_02490 [Chitinivibrionia bacterium]|nr:hypothetical protein [Chitinivibrionia bacterium]
MKKPIFVAILACIVLFVAGCGFFDDNDDDGGWYGNGSAGNYNIGTVAQLIQLAEIVNGTYKSGDITLPADDFKDKTVTLTADINLNNQEWKMIGASNRTFNGTFDGDNKTISNLNSTKYSKRFFYKIGEHGTVKNIVFTDLNISSSSESVGGLINENRGKIQNISIIDGTVSVNDNGSAGGIVRYNYDYGIVENCNFSGSVSAYYGAGGIAISNSANGIIRNCYVTGAVTTRGNSGTGGIVGSNSGTVKNCYTTCSVTGGTFLGYEIGGIVGINIGTVENCYTTGNISGTYRIGGIVGIGESAMRVGTVKNCYATGNVTGDSNLGGITGAYGTVQNCVALNSSITSTKTSSSIGRISSYNNTLNSYASNGMVTKTLNSNITAKSDANGIHGADVESSNYNSQEWWTTASNWDSESLWDFTNVWECDNTINLPKLR